MSINEYYPEECDTTGADCLGCVRRTAEATTALTGTPSAEWASGLFRRMYSYAACRQMEHSYIFACGVEPMAAILGEGTPVQILASAAAA